MNLFYEEYPTSIEVAGKEIQIVTDFREYVKLMDLLNCDELNPGEKQYFVWQYFKEPPASFHEALEALTSFVKMDWLKRPEVTYVDAEEEKTGGKELFSFEVDYPFIFAAFLRDYNINIRTIEYMHWWEFRMLFDGLSEDTEIKQRIMYRSIDPGTIKDRDERRRIEKIQRSIQLPSSALTDYEIGDAFM